MPGTRNSDEQGKFSGIYILHGETEQFEWKKEILIRICGTY